MVRLIYGIYGWQVSVPCNNMFNVLTVRCGHCANLLSVSMASSFQTLPSPQDPQVHIYIYILANPLFKKEDVGLESCICFSDWILNFLLRQTIYITPD